MKNFTFKSEATLDHESFVAESKMARVFESPELSLESLAYEYATATSTSVDQVRASEVAALVEEVLVVVSEAISAPVEYTVQGELYSTAKSVRDFDIKSIFLTAFKAPLCMKRKVSANYSDSIDFCENRAKFRKVYQREILSIESLESVYKATHQATSCVDFLEALSAAVTEIGRKNEAYFCSYSPAGALYMDAEISEEAFYSISVAGKIIRALEVA